MASSSPYYNVDGRQLEIMLKVVTETYGPICSEFGMLMHLARVHTACSPNYKFKDLAQYRRCFSMAKINGLSVSEWNRSKNKTVL